MDSSFGCTGHLLHMITYSFAISHFKLRPHSQFTLFTVNYYYYFFYMFLVSLDMYMRSHCNIFCLTFQVLPFCEFLKLLFVVF